MVLKHERKTLGPAVMFLLVMVASPAISKDFGILTRTVCIVADPTFASETSGPTGNMRDYAQHVKAEVTAGLNETETHSLLKSAAGLAKAEALQALRSLRPEGLEIETARVTRWCHTVVTPFVRQVIDTHDNHHTQI
jgi:hypothetical protein